ncbi:hypothetical protein [Deinococcus radiotolerans]|uniref:Lipoprotein n=1 Tax=Deinococcus radiotolerans TaxID=1309407 RepID=A0ABQ2FP76_9DEIO|nr:hypothetical protein [Deinococcus radiotolerans]GGL13248.1 hypothetical protein GCM10010844_35080 [Deinococcus radiotolerans]
MSVPARITLRRLSTALPLTLLLACSPAPHAPPTPEASRGPVYALDLQVSGAQVAQASLHTLPAGTPGLSSQALETTPGDVQLGAQSVSSVTFVSRRGAQDIRHVNTTFMVTNPTGEPITNLVLLPVALTDTDGDPSNNATAPTLAGTPFRSVRLYGGQDAATQAPNLRVTRAQDLDLQTGVTRPHPQGTPFLTDLDLRGLQVTPPAGLSVTPQSGGWLVPGTLAPGASVPVTFAVDFPVDRQHPETQVFSFSLLFTSAQDRTGSEVGGPTDPARVVGTLHHPLLGQGARVEEQYLDYDRIEWVTAQNVPLAADGQVAFTLSTPPAGALSSLFECSDFVGDRSQPDALAVQANLQVIGTQGDPLGRALTTSLTPAGLTRLYVDRDIRVQGRCDDLAAGGTITYQDQLDLKRGWNLIQQQGRSTDTGYIIQRTSIPTGIWSRLTFQLGSPRVSVAAPQEGSSIHLPPGQSATVPFDLRQGGGISGPITLGVDVPGVTVSPSTLTLPSLTTQNLGAQALQTTLTFHADATLSPDWQPLNLTIRKDGQIIGRSLFILNDTP